MNLQDRCRGFSAIEDHFDELQEKLDDQTHDLASLVETCERELHSILRDSYSLELEVDNCICKNVIEHTELKSELQSLEHDFNSLELKLDNYIFDNDRMHRIQLHCYGPIVCTHVATARRNLVPKRV